ncbi:hypothetical protein GQX74_005655 [Glossina fuscipes]|nr:hypothetical protein GQX74_005655 [Glossina fuscipes]
MEQAGATSNIYQDLLRVLLSSAYLDANMRLTCLQTLLNSGVSFLMTEVFPFSYYEKILQVIAAQGTGLRVLNLKGVWIKNEHMNYMFEIVKKYEYLTKLYVPYIAKDDLLEVISKYCERLQVLDISGETDITEIGIAYLSKGVCSNRLTVIDVGVPGEENICYSDIALILENCPNVETLSTYSFVGPALKFIYNNINTDFKCKLKYLHDTGTDEETLQTIGNGELALDRLAYICPLLVDLNCYMMDRLVYTSGQKRFIHLEGLEMLTCPITNTSRKALICNVTQLKRLAVDSVTFNGEDIVSIFIEHDFKDLEDIRFTLAPNLTVQSIEILMDRRPELQTVGQLSGWALTPDHLALIRGLLKSASTVKSVIHLKKLIKLLKILKS